MSAYTSLSLTLSLINSPRIFVAYGQMDPAVQNVVQDLITPLIRSLGPSHSRLLTLLRTFPPHAEGLALRVLSIFTENGRPSPQLVAIVKGLVSERQDLREGALAARFLIPVIGEMDKVGDGRSAKGKEKSLTSDVHFSYRPKSYATFRGSCPCWTERRSRRRWSSRCSARLWRSRRRRSGWCRRMCRG